MLGKKTVLSFVILAGGVLLAMAAACGGGGSGPSAPALTPSPLLPTSTAPPVPTPTPKPVFTCPLDGLPVQDPALLWRRPLLVKIDNSQGARPQSGLSQAGIVFEHVTEGGITRFTALYLRTDPPRLGPIRSARLVDIDIAREYDGMLAHVGASGPVMQQIRNSGISDLDQFFHAAAYQRVPERLSPHNVYTSSAALRALARELGFERAPRLRGIPFSEEVRQGGSPALIASVPFSSGYEVSYRYDATKRRYARFMAGQPHVDAETSQQLEAANVVVQFVPILATDIREDESGSPSLTFDRVGAGDALIFRDGQVFKARWQRDSDDERTRYLDESGHPIPLKPGPTWVELLAPGAPVTWTP